MYYYLKSGPVKKDRYTFGFLDENRDNDYHNQILDGISEAARELGIDIIRFSYYSSHIAYKFSHQIDIVIDHIQQYDLDGLLFLGWTQAGAMYNRENFIKRFGDMPMMSLGVNYKDIPSVYFPGDRMIAKMTRHLIEEHHYSRIAYIEHYREDNRKAAYEKVMKEYGLYDPSLYVGNDVLPSWTDPQMRSRRAAEILLDERGIDVQAVITLGCDLAGYFIDALEGRGIRVPSDIAVVSYEENDFAEYSLPGITTIYYPWRELGYNGCRNLAGLLREGKIPQKTVIGECDNIICRGSCGCLPYYLKPADDRHSLPEGHGPDMMSEEEKNEIEKELKILYGGSGINFARLVDSFASSCISRDSMQFLSGLDRELRYARRNIRLNELITDMRNLFYPYLINDMDMLVWSGDLFMQAQVIVSDSVARFHGGTALMNRMKDRNMQTLKQELFMSFSLNHLTDTVEKAMKLLNVDNCHIFISNSIFTGTDVEESLFDNSVLIFRYKYGKRLEVTGKAGGLRQQLADIREEIGHVSLAYLLHVTDEIMGLAIFGPGSGAPDEVFYQNLSTSISTVLHGIVLLNRLNITYKKLVEHARKEGMADIAADILHSIGNMLNSINVSLHLMEESMKSSVIDDLIMAGDMLLKNINCLEEFICSDPKGKKLMKLYLNLGNAARQLFERLTFNLDRIAAKVRTINEAVAAQQSYAGVDEKLEDLLIEPIIEDALKLNQESFEKLRIKVEKDYMPGFKAHVNRAKLFFIIFNIISNATDALINSSNDGRKLTVRTYMDDRGKYIEIGDNGRGIPEEIIDRIFEYGFSTKEGRYGYGLYSCAAYMEDMNGSIWARSEGENKGSSFILKFM